MANLGLKPRFSDSVAHDPNHLDSPPEIFGEKMLRHRQAGLDELQHSPTPELAPTLILKLPLLQLSLDLVQHHGQLPQDLLQVAHVIVFQDLGLRTRQAGARGAELASIGQR